MRGTGEGLQPGSKPPYNARVVGEITKIPGISKLVLAGPSLSASTPVLLISEPTQIILYQDLPAITSRDKNSKLQIYEFMRFHVSSINLHL